MPPLPEETGKLGHYQKLHPDSSNGSAGQFVLLGKAKAAIEEANGWV